MRPAWWLALALTLALHGAMALWSLPALAAMAGGLAPFDLRLLGYDPEAARALVAALGPEGAIFYTGVQHRLDALAPALLALVLAGAAVRLAPGWGGRGLALAAGAGAGLDWAENLAVGALLRAGPEGFDAALAARASLLTQARWALTLALVAVLAVLAVRAAGRPAGRPGGRT